MSDAAGLNEAIEYVKAFGGPTTVAALGWWLKTQFTKVHQAGEKRMRKHERQDERRHRDNLVRFTKIGAKLGVDDIVGDTNGHDDTDDDDE